MKVRWAIVGCGDIANKAVAPALKDHDQAELVALFSNSRERAEELMPLRHWLQCGRANM